MHVCMHAYMQACMPFCVYPIVILLLSGAVSVSDTLMRPLEMARQAQGCQCG